VPGLSSLLLVELLVLADTHLRGGLDLPPMVLEALRRADAVLHAGDVTSARALAELEGTAPTYAVLGNNDLGLDGVLPPDLSIELEGVTIALVHNSGDRQGRPGRLQRRFPSAGVVVFGHSHVPVDECGIGTQLLFNPGSPTQRRAQPVRTFGWLSVADGRVVARRIVPIE
jgi:putative phosphoesterase